MSHADDPGPLVFITVNVKGTINTCQVYQIKRNINKVKQKRVKPPKLQKKKPEKSMDFLREIQ